MWYIVMKGCGIGFVSAGVDVDVKLGVECFLLSLCGRGVILAAENGWSRQAAV